nr:hypothetical protein [Tanacetum cinerariifolium]
MYGLHQAPRAWYGILSKYLLTNGFQRGTIDQTLFIRRHRGDFILVQVYVDDIIFGSSNLQVCREFEALTHEKIQMSAMVKRIFRYLKGHPKLGLWYPKESLFDLVAYSDSEYGGASQDRKSTTEGCQFFGRRLISWQCKKQTIVATSTTEAEYVAAANENVADLLTKPFDAGRFQYLVNINFHLIVDFVEASHLRIETSEERTKILATVDGKLRTVSESSIRRNLKFNDEVGISFLPDEELFENLTLMGYNISPNQKFTFQKGRAKIIQSSALPPIADEPASFIGDDSQREACPTNSGLEADSDRVNIPKTSTLPSDSTPRVTSLAANEGSMQQKLNELMTLCTSLQRQQSEMISKFAAQELEINRLKARIKLLEDKDRGGRRLDEGEEAAERVSDDTEEMATVLTSIDAASILT